MYEQTTTDSTGRHGWRTNSVIGWIITRNIPGFELLPSAKFQLNKLRQPSVHAKTPEVQITELALDHAYHGCVAPERELPSKGPSDQQRQVWIIPS